MNKTCKHLSTKTTSKLKEVNDLLYIKNKGRKRLRLDISLTADGCSNPPEICKNVQPDLSTSAFEKKL